MFRSPARYVQGSGAIKELPTLLKELGKSIFFLVDTYGEENFKPILEKTLEGSGLTYTFHVFEGECCKNEINRISSICKERSDDMVVGVGGGKISDTAKAVANFADLPVALLPTAATSNAPNSRVSVLYKEDGSFDQLLFSKANPNLILIDTDFILSAPAKMLAAGMGDALACYFEARAVQRSGNNNQIGAKPTLAAYALAKLCHQTLMEDGLLAKIAVEKGQSCAALENVVEASVLLSGIGFESGGLAAAHAIQRGFTLLPELHGRYHGELVAFAAIVQLVLEHAPKSELEEVIKFCKSVGLPTTFHELGIENPDDAKLNIVAEKACASDAYMYKMPMSVEPDMVVLALTMADELGRTLK